MGNKSNTAAGKEKAGGARLRLRVTAAAEREIRAGHPWLFAGSIHESNREGATGELAVIYDRRDEFLAIGLYDVASPLRVRVLHAGKPQTIDEAWWNTRLAATIQRRDALWDEGTTGGRLINGESDGWPGFVLDRYGATLVLKLYTAAWLPRLDEMVELIRAQLQPERIILRLSRNIQASAKPREDGEVLCGSAPEGAVVFLETGLNLEADVLRGQKTGFFLDQRENRRAVERLARGRTVLNAFSFSGGFSLYAARGGAKSATDIDLSAHALAAAVRNFALNQNDPPVAACAHELVQADAFDWLAGNGHRRFDLIVLDPPSLARRETERAGAIHAYGRLAALGISHLSAGGILVACSCSAHVSTEEFFAVVRQSATQSKRPFREQGTSRHALDHPATFAEAEYLKAIFLEF